MIPVGRDAPLRMLARHHQDDTTFFWGSGVPEPKLFTCHWNAWEG